MFKITLMPQLYQICLSYLNMEFCTADRAAYEKLGDDAPFEIPTGWAWCKWGDISLSVQYGYSAPAVQAGHIRMVRITDIQDGHINWDSVPYCQIEATKIPRYKLQKNDILFARTGGTVGKSHLITETPLDAVYAGYLVRTQCASGISPQYAKLFLESELYWEQLKVGMVATAQPNFNGEKLSSMILPLPPFSEQKRIVARVEELFKIADSLDEAADGLEKVEKRLDKKILDLAIRGKLVPQDPSDEPASELLKRFASTSHKSPCKNHETPIEPPFATPESWEWVKLKDLGVFCGGHTPSMSNPNFWGGDVLWVSSKDMKSKYITDTQMKVSRLGAEELKILKPGTLLMCTRSGILRRTFPIAIAKRELTINQDQRALILHLPEMAEYIYVALKSLEPAILLTYKKAGTTVESIIWDKFIDLPIPLPPLGEQKRIVAKVNELTTLLQTLVAV